MDLNYRTIYLEFVCIKRLGLVIGIRQTLFFYAVLKAIYASRVEACSTPQKGVQAQGLEAARKLPE